MKSQRGTGISITVSPLYQAFIRGGAVFFLMYVMLLISSMSCWLTMSLSVTSMSSLLFLSSWNLSEISRISYQCVHMSLCEEPSQRFLSTVRELKRFINIASFNWSDQQVADTCIIYGCTYAVDCWAEGDN